MTPILSKLTQTILNEPTDFLDLTAELNAMHEVYASITGIAAHGRVHTKDIYTPFGKAISPTGAAHCLLEMQRTAVFVRGIHKAILQLKKDFPGERIRILYAGCGPYATLVTPLTALFTAEEISFHLLDINEISLTAVEKVYRVLGLSNYVTEYILGDATTYTSDPDAPFHLMISETMLHALMREPQVSIMLNLVPQLPEKGIFIPEEITVSAQLLDSKKETESFSVAGMIPERIKLGILYTIGRHNCNKHSTVTITIPEEPGTFKSLYLLTDITTYEDQKLGAYNCSLNLPIRITEAEAIKGRQMTFDYVIGENPGFKHQLVETEDLAV